MSIAEQTAHALELKECAKNFGWIDWINMKVLGHRYWLEAKSGDLLRTRTQLVPGMRLGVLS